MFLCKFETDILAANLAKSGCAVVIVAEISAAKLSNSLTLAEGVETYGEFKVIKRLGIDLVQGFSLHHPQDEKDILKSLKKGNKK